MTLLPSLVRFAGRGVRFEHAGVTHHLERQLAVRQQQVGLRIAALIDDAPH